MAINPVRILVIANTGWYLYKFRFNLIQALVARGDDVCISCPEDDYSARLISELGVQWYPIPANPRRVVPHLELLFIAKLFLACWHFRPGVCLTYTPRVNCFIALVPLKTLGIRLIRNISGLGDSLMSEKKLQTLLAKFLYRRGSRGLWTFYQNEHDMQLGFSNEFSTAQDSSLLPGSGVELDRFHYRPRQDAQPLQVLMAARLIPAKGYLDFIELALQSRASSTFEFHLAGGFSDESGVSREEFDKLLDESGVVFHGYTEDLVPLYQQSHMVVLPSRYGEGLPRVLLEAAACGCALLAYDNPGSNRAIQQGVNGWTTATPSVSAMRETLHRYGELSHADREAMASASRHHVENGFSEEVVINSYLELLT